MIRNPRLDQPVMVWYNAKDAPRMPLHNKVGVVVIASRPIKRYIPPMDNVPKYKNTRKVGPINHGILIDGQIYVVPHGNLQRIKEAA